MSEAAPNIQLEPSWRARIGDWLLRPEMRELAAFLRQRKAAGATIYPAGGNQTVTWSSKDESIATVSDKGVVTGVGKGTTTITAECGGVKADCTVYITAK